MRGTRLLLAALTAIACLPAGAGTLAPNLLDALSRANRDDRLPVVVLMDEFPDQRRLLDEVRGMSREARRAHVVSTMKALARRSQSALQPVLADEEALGRIRDVRVLWGVNGVALEASREVIERLATGLRSKRRAR